MGDVLTPAKEPALNCADELTGKFLCCCTAQL